MSTLLSLKYQRGSLSVLDQLKLPHETDYIVIKNSEDAWSSIRTMQVRGAPLIAIVAALGLAVEIFHPRDFESVQSLSLFIREKLDFLRSSRPTAVNLFTATDNLRKMVENLERDCSTTLETLINSYIQAAEDLLKADVTTNKAIGDHGANKILEIVGSDKIKVLTICNTGSLATAGYGTALGVVRSLHAMGRLEHVYACETRPYNQGARLTAFEIVHDNLPGTLIADSMASALMAVKGVDCVVVGADRVAANGDTANKIGTYQLAIAAKYHGVPFFAAVPTTTIDVTMSSGAQIHVEERPADELTTIFGKRIAPEGINVWNPSFDVTPCSLITGIITELGVAQASVDAGSDGIIDIVSFLRSNKFSEVSLEKAVTPTAIPPGYRKLDTDSVAAYVLALPKLRRLLQVTEAEIQSSSLQVEEVGDGNLNDVYIVTAVASGAKLVLKQALPYVRCVGESWPLTLKRATFERNALTAERKICEDLVPEIYHFNERMAVIVMRFIEAPHIILRKALIQGARITSFASHIATFLAKTLFHTSALALDGGTFRLKVSEWSTNTSMCALSEKVIFTDPYMDFNLNKWTTPHLDTFASKIKSDSKLKLAASDLKAKFLSSTQALIHGDIHTGSVMAMEGSTFVIDSEFAFYGPMGFDVGAVVGNLLLSYFSQAGSNGAEYAEWVLSQLVQLHKEFVAKFVEEWNAASVQQGDSENIQLVNEIFRVGVFQEASLLQSAQAQVLESVWKDTLGFAGLKMIRRIVGIAHVADLESIEDLDLRSSCERRALVLARNLVLAAVEVGSSAQYADIDALAAASRLLYNQDIPSQTWPYIL